MAIIEQPISIEQQVDMMKKYVTFRQKKKIKDFLSYAGYFRASRYGKYLLSLSAILGYMPSQKDLFELYKFDAELRRILMFYCNRAEIRMKSAISNACAIKAADGTFYLNAIYYTPSRGESDAKKRRGNIYFFNNYFFRDIKSKESKLRKDVLRYPELKEYRKGGSRHSNKLPIWVTFSYVELGTVTLLYNYLRLDMRKAVLQYAFSNAKYSKQDTEIMDTWLDGLRTLRNYCAHNSMIVGMNAAVVRMDTRDDQRILIKDNDLFSRIYALKKLIPDEDIPKLKKDIAKIISRTKFDVVKVGILPNDWEDRYDSIIHF